MRLRAPVRTRDLRLRIMSVIDKQVASVTIFEFKAFENSADVKSEISPEVIAVWEKAGAKFGWLSEIEAGGTGLPGELEWRQAEPVSGGVPAFKFSKFPDGKLNVLPPPGGSLWLVVFWKISNRCGDERASWAEAVADAKPAGNRGDRRRPETSCRPDPDEVAAP